MNLSGGILKLPKLVKAVETHRREGKRIVLCFGVFDLIHPGHIRFLTAAKKHGDILIVGIPADRFVNKGPGRPIFKQELRAEVLESITGVDYVVIMDSPTASDVIEAVRPDVFVKGHDEELDGMMNGAVAEEEFIRSYGGKVVVTTDDISFSSSKLIANNLGVYPPKTKAYLDQFKKKYPIRTIFDSLDALKKTRILILGETIIDQYVYCRPMGKSSKEPVMVNQYISEESFAGGVLATANHAASLSDDVTLVTILGKKQSFRRFILGKLRSAVKPVFFYQSGVDTIIKRRFVEVENKQKLFQISYLEGSPTLPAKLETSIVEFLKEELPKFDLVIVNDFGHGMFTDAMIRQICRKSKYLALNVQANSANYGFNVITKYERADFVCIDDQEIRLATHDKYGDLEPQIKNIITALHAKLMIVTKGPKGTIAYSGNGKFLYAPALADRIVDRVGAGDALFAVTSPCAYAGMPVDVISFIANVAGALKTQVVGNRSQIENTQLKTFIDRLLK